MEFFHSQLDYGRPYAVGPGVPKDRVEAMRKVFSQVVADPDVRAEAEKQGLEVEPLDGEKLQAVIARFYATPQDIVDRANAALGAKK
jgi:tripartite-type tricarboxylate transporter receptor subunit TctC